MSKNEKSQGVLNEKEQAPQTHTPTDHPPEGETQTTEGNTPKTLPELPSIAPQFLHEIEGNPEPTSHEQATESVQVQTREQTSKPKRKGDEGR